jgi:hypothetical protein
MKKGKSAKTNVSAEHNIVEALSRISTSTKWFKLTAQEKSEFEKARFAEEQSKKAGFVLGGPLKQVL